MCRLTLKYSSLTLPRSAHISFAYRSIFIYYLESFIAFSKFICTSVCGWHNSHSKSRWTNSGKAGGKGKPDDHSFCCFYYLYIIIGSSKSGGKGRGCTAIHHEIQMTEPHQDLKIPAVQFLAKHETPWIPRTNAPQSAVVRMCHRLFSFF